MSNIPPSLQPEQHPTGRRFATVASLLFVAMGCGCWLSFDPLWIMNDSTQAMSVARHLLAGEGIRSDIIYYPEQYATQEVPAPQTVFPPGFPALIAAVTLFGMPMPEAAFAITAFCFIAVALLILWMARRLGLSLGTATVLTLCWCGCLQCWNNAWVMMSEMPFIAFTLLSLLLFPARVERSRLRWLLLSGGAAAAAFTIRYAGVFWFLTVAIHYLAQMIRRRELIWLRDALTWGSVPILTTATLFWRNHTLSGEWTGGNPLGEQRPFSISLWEMYQSISRTVGMAKSRLLSGGGAEWLCVVAVVSIGLWLLVHRRRWRIIRPARQDRKLRPWIALSAAYLAISFALLLYLHSRTPIGLGPRKILPLLPFALLLVGVGVKHVCIDHGPPRRHLAASGLMLLAALIWGQVNVWNQLTSRSHGTGAIARALQTPVGTQTLQEMLAGEISAAAPLLTNEPHYVNYFLERPVLGLPEPDYTDLIWTPQEVRRVIKSYDVRHVTVFHDVLADASFRPPFFEQLAAGQVPGWLRAVYDDEHVSLFAVRVSPNWDNDSMAPLERVSLSSIRGDVPVAEETE